MAKKTTKSSKKAKGKAGARCDNCKCMCKNCDCDSKTCKSCKCSSDTGSFSLSSFYLLRFANFAGIVPSPSNYYRDNAWTTAGIKPAAWPYVHA